MSAITAGDGRIDGAFFEEVFLRFARYAGLFPKKNPYACQVIGQGRYKLIFGQLDFRVVDRRGVTGFFDTKSFQGDSFTFSMLNPKQVEEASQLNEWNVPAGFVVFFRGVNRVAFFSGRQIREAGPRSSFRPVDGLDLGTLETLDLKPLFDSRAQSPNKA